MINKTEAELARIVSNLGLFRSGDVSEAVVNLTILAIVLKHLKGGIDDGNV